MSSWRQWDSRFSGYQRIDPLGLCCSCKSTHYFEVLCIILLHTWYAVLFSSFVLFSSWAVFCQGVLCESRGQATPLRFQTLYLTFVCNRIKWLLNTVSIGHARGCTTLDRQASNIFHLQQRIRQLVPQQVYKWYICMWYIQWSRFGVTPPPIATAENMSGKTLLVGIGCAHILLLYSDENTAAVVGIKYVQSPGYFTTDVVVMCPTWVPKIDTNRVNRYYAVNGQWGTVATDGGAASCVVGRSLWVCGVLISCVTNKSRQTETERGGTFFIWVGRWWRWKWKVKVQYPPEARGVRLWCCFVDIMTQSPHPGRKMMQKNDDDGIMLSVVAISLARLTALFYGYLLLLRCMRIMDRGFIKGEAVRWCILLL